MDSSENSTNDHFSHSFLGTLDGEWILVLHRRRMRRWSRVRPPNISRALGEASSSSTSFSNFERAKSLISGKTVFWKGFGVSDFELRYKTIPGGGGQFSTTRGSSVVMRRIAYDVVKHRINLLGKIPLPSFQRRRRRGNRFLDFVYMDRDIRMTTTEKGDLFLYARPGCIKRLLR